MQMIDLDNEKTNLSEQYDRDGAQIINISELKRNTTRLRKGMIAPPREEVHTEVVEEHSAEPIKSLEDICGISKWLIQEGRYRDNMLFIVGINFGLRASDLRTLRFSDIINSNLSFKERFPVFEQKTRNTRKRKKNRYVTINHAVIEAVTLYLEHTPNISLSDYMFRSISNNGAGVNKPLEVRSMDRILKKIADEYGLNMRVSTHTLRKTFGYHQMVMSGNDNRKLLLLQKIFNHSSPQQTLDYIGITSEEIDDAYKQLNLGSVNHNYLIDSDIGESETQPA